MVQPRHAQIDVDGMPADLEVTHADQDQMPTHDDSWMVQPADLWMVWQPAQWMDLPPQMDLRPPQDQVLAHGHGCWMLQVVHLWREVEY